MPYQADPSFVDNSNDNLIATFNVCNANGKRVTSKDAKVFARHWWVRVKITEKEGSGKDVTRLRNMQAGYAFRRGEQLKAQVVVLVPMGEKPNVELLIPYTMSND